MPAPLFAGYTEDDWLWVERRRASYWIKAKMREKGEKEGKETWRERQGDDNTIEVTGDIWLQSQTFSYVKKQILYTPTQLSLSYFESDFFHLPLKDFFSIFLVLLTPFIVPSFKFLTFPQQWHDQLQSYGHHQCTVLWEHGSNADCPRMVPPFTPASRPHTSWVH